MNVLDRWGESLRLRRGFLEGDDRYRERLSAKVQLDSMKGTPAAIMYAIRAFVGPGYSASINSFRGRVRVRLQIPILKQVLTVGLARVFARRRLLRHSGEWQDAVIHYEVI